MASAPIPQASGTTIGNMTEQGGLVAAFDGRESQTQAQGAYHTGATDGTVGKDYGSGVAYRVVRWRGIGSSDFGWNNQPGNGACTVHLEWSDDNTTFTSVDNVSVNQVPGLIDRIVPQATVAHRYWRLRITGTTGDKRCAEAEFHQAASIELLLRAMRRG